MKKVLKSFKFELYKTVSNKMLMISFFIFLIILLTILTALVYNHKPSKVIEHTNKEKSEMIAKYEWSKDFFQNALNNLLTKPSGSITDKKEHISSIKGYQEGYGYYDYLLKTNTFESDYLNNNTVTKSNRGIYVMEMLLRQLAYILPVFAILLTLFVLNKDYFGGTGKNISASLIGRTNTLYGKVLFIIFTNFIVFLLSVAVPIFIGLLNKNAPRLLLYGSKGYYAQSPFLFISFPLATSIFMSMIFYSTITLVVSLLLKKKLYRLLAPFAIFILFQFAYLLFYTISSTDIIYILMPLEYIRLNEDLQLLFNALAVAHNWMYLIFVCLVIVSFLLICSKLCAKKIEKLNF